jgi:hypothetical protein
MRGPKVEEIKWYLEWKKNRDDFSWEQMLDLYSDISRQFLDDTLTFDMVDGWDWEYIICSTYVNRKNIDWFMAVLNRDCRWSCDNDEEFAEYIWGLYDRAMEILDDCNQDK